MKRNFLLLAIAMLCVGTFASADNFVYSNCRTCGFTTDTFDWGQLGPEFTSVSSPTIVFSTGGTNAALVGDTKSGSITALVSGSGWPGNFNPGENLVWTGNPANGAGGPFLIELANPVGGIGFGIQAYLLGPFQAVVDVYDSNLNYQTTFTLSGTSTNSMAGDNLFIGIQDTTAVNIGAIVISTYSGGAPYDQDFALDAVGFNYTTPEPGSLILLGSGLIGAAGFVRHKLGR